MKYCFSRYRLIFFLLVVLVLDAIIGALLKPYFTEAALGFYKRYDVIVGLRSNADVVFTGDSHTQHGVDPKYFSRICGCSSENISVSGGNMITTYYLLRGYLEHNIPPKVVFLEASWQNISVQPNGEHKPLILEKLNFRDQAYYFMHSLDWNFAAKKVLKSYRYRNALGKFLRRDDSVDTKFIPEKGFYPMEGSLDVNFDIQLEFTRQFFSSDILIDNAELYYTEKTISMLKSIGSRVIMVEPPVYFGWLSAVKNLQELHSALLKIAEKFGVSYYNFSRLDDPFIKERIYFHDEQHLNVEGAQKYAENLQKLLNN